MNPLKNGETQSYIALFKSAEPHIISWISL